MRVASARALRRRGDHDDVVWGRHGWLGFALMIVSTVVFWGVLITGGIALFRYLNRTAVNPGSGETRPTPEQLARGAVRPR
jgi:hypothetical protein